MKCHTESTLCAKPLWSAGSWLQKTLEPSHSYSYGPLIQFAVGYLDWGKKLHLPNYSFSSPGLLSKYDSFWLQMVMSYKKNRRPQKQHFTNQWVMTWRVAPYYSLISHSAYSGPWHLLPARFFSELWPNFPAFLCIDHSSYSTKPACFFCLSLCV